MSNWFKKQGVHSLSLTRKSEMVDKLEEVCDHVREDYTKLYIISTEMDSFGPVCEFGMCKECHDKMKQEEADEEVVCHDCHQKVKKSDTISWRWYDFYAPQGDEPLTICKECTAKPKHVNRVKKDHAEYVDEMAGFPSLNQEDDDYGYYD